MALIGFTVDELEIDTLDYPGFFPWPGTVAVERQVEHEIAPLVSLSDTSLNPVLALASGGGGSTEIEELVPEQYIRGTVLDVDGAGIPRLVIAVDRATGQRMATTMSEVSGNFVIRPRTLDPVILVAVPNPGENINAVVLDNILPVPD